jgi:hypothetical protein
MRRLARIAPFLALFALHVPVVAQGTHAATRDARIVLHDGAHQFEVRYRGEVALNDAGDAVESLGPGAEVVVEERDGARTRRAEIVRTGDGLRTRYAENGVVREMDPAAHRWLAESIQRAARHGLGVEARVQRLRRQGGVAAVLRETARAGTDSGKRLHLTVLLRGEPLTREEFTRVMRFVEREISSDADRRLVLGAATGQASDRARMAALLDATAAIGSDADKRLVIIGALDHALPRQGAAAAFVRAVDRIGSDADRRLVLVRLIDRRGPEPLLAGFFSSVDGMRSAADRRLVLTRLLRGDPPEADVLAALRSVERLSSPADMRLTLGSVPESRLRSRRVADAYRAAAARIDSPRDRGLALRRLGAGT